jgi:hypothetical protein
MASLVKIEVQDQFGRWQHFTRFANNPSSIKLGLERALKTQLASKSKKARAVDSDTGTLIDMAMG